MQTNHLISKASIAKRSKAFLTDSLAKLESLNLKLSLKLYIRMERNRNTQKFTRSVDSKDADTYLKPLLIHNFAKF
jgi:hypothetical protein